MTVVRDEAWACHSSHRFTATPAIPQVRVGETYGLKFPREFGLLLKQLLYFDRYLRLLAPDLQVFSDDRVNFATIGSSSGPGSVGGRRSFAAGGALGGGGPPSATGNSPWGRAAAARRTTAAVGGGR